MKPFGPEELMDDLRRRTAAKKRAERGMSAHPSQRSEIGGLLLLGLGGVITMASFLAMAVNWHGLIAAGGALFGVLLMKEGLEILWS